MTADPRTLDVTCPHCAARYLLPAHLLGPGGARVRCPGCGRSFDVPPPGAPAVPPPGDSRPSIARPAADREAAFAEAEAEVESDLRAGAAIAGAAAEAHSADEAPAAAGAHSAYEAHSADEAPAAAGAHSAFEALSADEEHAAEDAGREFTTMAGPAGAPLAQTGPGGARDIAPALAARDEAPAVYAEPMPAEAVAREVLEAVARRAGVDLAAASAQGHLFARYGPQIFAAFDEYRRRAGSAGSAPFRAALRGLWGVDLPEAPHQR